MRVSKRLLSVVLVPWVCSCGTSKGDNAGMANNPPAPANTTTRDETQSPSQTPSSPPGVSPQPTGNPEPGGPSSTPTNGTAPSPTPSAETTDTENTNVEDSNSIESGPGGTGEDTPSTPTPGTGETPPAEGCPPNVWPEADPSQTGPFEVATDNEVGPEAGEEEEDVGVPRFTMFRPADMEASGLCHPVITWGNGTGATPNLYGGMLRHFASHGFVVIASNSKNVGRGDPRPMNVGIDWVLEQNQDPASVLYQHIDTAHIGATGHSQGAFATSQASGDPRIVTSVPIEGAQMQRNLSGPAMFFCGGMDDIVPCDSARAALEAITTLPAMFANYKTADHGSWMGFGSQRSEVETAITAWMRVHLMADQTLRPWFYGASCTLCEDDAWEIERKNMDQ